MILVNVMCFLAGIAFALVAVYIAGWVVNRKRPEAISLGGMLYDGTVSFDSEAISQVPERTLAMMLLATGTFMRALEVEIDARMSKHIGDSIEEESEEWAQTLIEAME
jgi:hypothetical protein